MVYELEVGSESCSSEMLQEQLDALLADGEATSQQQQVRAHGVLGSRAAAHIAFSLPSPPPPFSPFCSWTNWTLLCRPSPVYQDHVTELWRLWGSLCFTRLL